MLLYIISDNEYKKALRQRIVTDLHYVSLGRVEQVSDAYSIASTLPCPTKVRVIGSCCYIVSLM